MKSFLTALRDLVCAHLVLNMVTVDLINFSLQKTICQNVLLTCCDPFSYIQPSLLGFPCNGWLVGHLLAYWWTGYYYGKNSLRNHSQLVICQLAWFSFEYCTFVHVWEFEQQKYYPSGTHPCPHNAYFSTWIPIWQDFVYNSIGQCLGWWLYAQTNDHNRKLKRLRDAAHNDVHKHKPLV